MSDLGDMQGETAADLVEPEYWVMRQTACLYCGRAASMSDDDDDVPFHEDMGVDGHTHGWVYCSECSAKHADNKKKYLKRHGYLTASQIFRDHPNLQTLDRARRVGLRVRTPMEHCIVYTLERAGWEIAKSYPYKYSCFERHDEIWVRLVNASIGSYACSHLRTLLEANQIDFDTVGSLKQATSRGLIHCVAGRARGIILDMIFSDRKNAYLMSVRRRQERGAL